MKILIVGAKCVEKKQYVELFVNALKDRDLTVDVWPEQRCITNTDVQEQGIDLLITFNLQGFHYRTLADGVAYNLLDCKQIHFLLDKNLENEKYLQKPLSIAMFFFCADKYHFDLIKQQYPELPYLESLDMEENDSAKQEALENAVAKVVRICRM